MEIQKLLGTRLIVPKTGQVESRVPGRSILFSPKWGAPFLDKSFVRSLSRPFLMSGVSGRSLGEATFSPFCCLE